MLQIRPAESTDREPIWSILEPIIRAGEVFTTPRDMTRESALAYWFAGNHEVFVVEDTEETARIVGTYYLQPNQTGAGAHVANCGYATASAAQGRGVARAMCEHSIDQVRHRGFRAMQFNFVVATNRRALRLWQSCGFEIVGRLPKAFHHPTEGYVDACVMWRDL